MARSDQVVIRVLEAVWTQGQADRAAEFIDDRYDLADLGRGPHATAANVRSSRSAFPDLVVEPVDVVSEDGRVAVWMRLSGTHAGVFRGYPATGRSVTWDEVGFFTVRDGKIAAGRFLADMFGLRKALGVLPSDTR